MNFSQIAKCILLKFPKVFVSKCESLFVSYRKMYLSQFAKWICFKLQNIFVSNCWSYMMYYIIKSSWKLSWPLSKADIESLLILKISHSRFHVQRTCGVESIKNIPLILQGKNQEVTHSETNYQATAVIPLSSFHFHFHCFQFFQVPIMKGDSNQFVSVNSAIYFLSKLVSHLFDP